MLTKNMVKYNVIKFLGKGGFAEVFLAIQENTNIYMAIKKINIKSLNYKGKQLLENEINILKNINHPNIVKFYTEFQNDNFKYIAMEYCDGGSLDKNLYDYINRYGKAFPENLVRKLMKQILSGVKVLHENNIIHRDLKLLNILLKYENGIDAKNKNLYEAQVKIIDFNSSYKGGYFTPPPQSVVGTIPNMAPSIVNKIVEPNQISIYDEKIDIWSLGTLCYEMLFGKPLFSHSLSKSQIFEKIKSCDFTIPKTISIEAESFLNNMLQKEGINRLSANQLLNHPFIINKKIILFKKNNIRNNNNRNIINNINNNINNNITNNINNNITNNINNRNNIIKNKNKQINNMNNPLNNNQNQRFISPQKNISPLRNKIMPDNKKVKLFITNKALNCNGCGKNGKNPSKNILYKCTECHNVIYCEECYFKFKNSHIHPFIQIIEKKIKVISNKNNNINDKPFIQRKPSKQILKKIPVIPKNNSFINPKNITNNPIVPSTNINNGSNFGIQKNMINNSTYINNYPRINFENNNNVQNQTYNNILPQF